MQRMVKLDRDGLLRSLHQLPVSTTSLTITGEEPAPGTRYDSARAVLVTKTFPLDLEIVEAMPSSLTTFRTDSVFLAPVGAATLGNLLSSATEIDLSYAHGSNINLVPFAESLQSGTLEVLRLSHNSLGEDGLAAVLKGQTRLRELDLSSNSLAWGEVDVLTDFLRTEKPPLQGLDLSNTKLSDLEAFDGVTLPELQVLNLRDNRFTKSPLEALAQIAPNLAELDIGDNKLGRREVRDLRANPLPVRIDGNLGTYSWRTRAVLVASFVAFQVIGVLNDAWSFAERAGATALLVAASTGIALATKKRDRELEARRHPPELEG